MSNEAINWVCPFCAHYQTLTDKQFYSGTVHIPLRKHKYGDVGLSIFAHASLIPTVKKWR
jgi:hypothetical protein